MGLRSWYKKKKAKYDAIKNMTPKQRADYAEKLKREVKVQQITNRNKIQQCPSSIEDLKGLEKQLDQGKCDDSLEWWCEFEVANYRDKMEKGHLCKGAVKILKRILSKHTIRTVEQINKDTENDWQVQLKF